MVRGMIMAAVGTVVLAGSTYGGYRIVSRNVDRTQAEIGEQAMTGKPSITDVRGNRPETAGDVPPVPDDVTRADLSGRIVTVGDGYLEIVTFVSGPGTGAIAPEDGALRPSGQGNVAREGAERMTPPGGVSGPETGETVRVSFGEATGFFTGSGGPGSDRTEIPVDDISEGDMASVWLAATEDDNMAEAEVIVVRTAASAR